MLSHSQLGNKISDARKSLGLSQAELAHQLGVSRASISLYESGNGQPSYQVLVKLASALGPLFSQSVGLVGAAGNQLLPAVQPTMPGPPQEEQMMLMRIEQQQAQIDELCSQVTRLNAQMDLLVKMLGEQRK